ncbi:MAG: M14 family metallopeptidase [Phycisphaeraceae bacterium]|nr:M14 family metallopeptidase [Phycisphaerales bacterium]QOJ18373.1 MAG: M14 family metallopeptidase [Phycisphaeraceae bacterium]
MFAPGLVALPLVFGLLQPSDALPGRGDEFLTVAESSEYTRTAAHAQVVDLMDRLASASPLAVRAQLGRTSEDREIPLLIIADPPVSSAVEARASGKVIFFAFANIHAGEVEGKEALLMLARELATSEGHPLLKDLVVVLAPIYNADGNDRFGPVARNRPGQDGPEEVGVRPNAQGFDLNRDYVKLESPEARALVRFFTEWDPHVTVDCHTTNGSYHRYTLTYDAPTNPSGFLPSIEFVRDAMLPEVTKRLLARTGYDTFFYGDFNRDHTAWVTYSAQPRYGGPYQGLRGQMQVLSEAYSYAPYRDRVICTREFVRELMTYSAEHREKVLELHQQARETTIVRGSDPQPSDVVGIRHRFAAAPGLVIAKGWEYENPPPPPQGEGRRGVRLRPTTTPKDYPVVHLGRFEPTLSVSRPLAYLIPPGHDDIVEKLRQHGVTVESFAGDAVVEAYEVTSIASAQQPFQGRTIRSLDVRASREKATLPQGSTIVRTAQPLGNLIVYLLEPQSEDGLAAWDFFGDRLMVGSRYPVMRVRTTDDLPAQ